MSSLIMSNTMHPFDRQTKTRASLIDVKSKGSNCTQLGDSGRTWKDGISLLFLFKTIKMKPFLSCVCATNRPVCLFQYGVTD